MDDMDNAIKQLAQVFKQYYDELVRVGFSKEQAFDLTQPFVESLIKPPQQKDPSRFRF